MELSNISTRPFWEHTFKSASVESHFSLTSATSRTLFKKVALFDSEFQLLQLSPDVHRWYQGMHGKYLQSPFLSRKAPVLALLLQQQPELLPGSLRLHKPRNFSTSSGATTTAIRSWDSEIAISVPSRPAYFFGTLSKSI